MYQISFQQIHYFLKLAQVLNYTEAAKQLYISQPALTKQIKALEKALTLTLFNRDHHTVTLTPAGALLAQKWTPLVRHLERSIEAAQAVSAAVSGPLRIGTTDSFAISGDLAPIIQQFQQRYPHVTLQLGSYSFRTIHAKFVANELDIVLVPSFEQLNYPHANHQFFKQIKLGLAVPGSFPLAQQNQLRLADCKNTPMIVMSPEQTPAGVAHIKALCHKHGFEPQIVQYAANSNSLIMAVENGIGFTICDSQIKSPNIKFFPFAAQDQDCTIDALWHPKNTKPAIQSFLNLLH
jgi:DNA-binding transcriptional LysR family regulator